MDYMYTFRQAHNDRLEDAGIKPYGQDNLEGYPIEIVGKSKPKNVLNRVKCLVIATLNTLVK